MGATRDSCIRQAVLGTVESFLDMSSARPQRTRGCRLAADRDDDLLYNANRPHSAHGALTPTEFALQWTTTHQPQAA